MTYILILFGALGASLILVLMYQQRTRSHLLRIESQKVELESAHQELKNAQAQLVAAEKFRQAKDIAGGFAHEIRNALFPGRAWMTKLRRMISREYDEDLLKTAVSRIDNSVSRAVEMTDQILRFTKLESEVESEVVNICPVIKEILNELSERLDANRIQMKISLMKMKNRSTMFERPTRSISCHVQSETVCRPIN